MRNSLVLFAALALVLSAHAQKTLTLPNGNTVERLANGETWATIRPNGTPIAIQLTSGMPATGEFQTQIVMNLPESDILNAPQSEDIALWGYCDTKTYTVIGVIPFSGKMRSGVPAYPELETGPGRY